MDDHNLPDDNDLTPIVPRDVLVKQGTSAIGYIAGGVFLLILTFGGRFPLLGIILSLTALVIGIAALLSRDREDKKPGIVIAVAGILGLVMRFGIPELKPFAGFILGLSGLGLFAAGLWKGVKFLWGLRSRQ